MGTVLTPPIYEELKGASIFLAGPIQGAVDWQDVAIKYIQSNAPKMHITSPRGPPESYKGNFTVEDYKNQVIWEKHFLNRALNEGAIMFWLAKEDEHLCRRSYAQTSRVEYGKFVDKGPLALGIEEGFSGAKYIRLDFKEEHPDLIINSTLEDTCNEAIRLARVHSD